MKKLSEKTEQKIVNPNPIEVIKFLDRHCLAILFKVYLSGVKAIFKLPRETSYGWVFKLCGHFCEWQFEAN